MNDKKKPKQSDPKQARELPFEWHFPDGLITRYANQMFLMTAESEFVLCFFEAHPPVVIGKSEEEIEEKAKQVKTIKAECVARIVIAKDRMPAFLNAMNTHVQRVLGIDAEKEGTKK